MVMRKSVNNDVSKDSPIFGGFFALPVWGAYIWGGLYMEGAYFRNFTLCCLCKLLRILNFYNENLKIFIIKI